MIPTSGKSSTAAAAAMRIRKVFLLCLLILAGVLTGSGATNSQDANALTSLVSQWQNVPSSWKSSNDPCSTPWYGVTCSGGRVTELRWGSIGLEGSLPDAIGQLTGLDYLDLSNNPGLSGTLPSSIGLLTNLQTLILLDCSFSGNIPVEIGNLTELSFLALNSNKFSGTIPPWLGRCQKLNWVDLSDNQLIGTIPVTSSTSPHGLDELVMAQHFHFNKNQLQGPIPPSLFNENMKLIHIILDENQITGSIPSSIGYVTTLEILQLDNNQLSGPIPTNISSLTSLQRLTLSGNNFSGSIPDLSALVNLNYLDLSNIPFNPSQAPSWFSDLTLLTTLFMNNATLRGTPPTTLFTFPQIQLVSLAQNQFNGDLNMTGKISPQLQTVNFSYNSIGSVYEGSYNETLVLIGNPVCEEPENKNKLYCTEQKSNLYSTSLSRCGGFVACPTNQQLSPGSCTCLFPYQGYMTFPAYKFSDLSNATIFEELETGLATVTNSSVYLSNIVIGADNYLRINVSFFPLSGKIFGPSNIITISSNMNNQALLGSALPPEFGPCEFTGIPYSYGASSQAGFSLGVGAIAGIAVGGFVLIGAIAVLVFLYLKQKRKIEQVEAENRRNPFASWPGYGGKSFKDGPQLKGSRFFTFDELKKSTNGFLAEMEIGAGGYGKVYKGVLPDKVVVAIKRAQQGSMQGLNEFKNEIELLSRVHMKNLVSLLGFCYEEGEQMLVYEYVPNGTLRENLSRKRGKQLDWNTRLKIALGSAKGLAYLHELADPPIIHRDVKSANILLDEQYNAKVADFGLSKLLEAGEQSHVSTQVKGTLGYLDPEYYMTQQLSEKSDVFSFGVVMLELITARPPLDKGKYIVRIVKEAVDKYDQEYYGLQDIVDPVIRSNANSVGFRKFVQLALDCVEDQAANRPTMNEVVKEIDIIIQNEGISLPGNPGSSTGFSGSTASPYEEYGMLSGDAADTTTFSNIASGYVDIKAK